MAVYFIQNTTTRSIKIGWTDNLPRRLKALQTSCEHELILLCSVSGGRELERSVHRRLASHHIRGEWFRNAPEVVQVVSEMVAGELARQGEINARRWRAHEVCGSLPCCQVGQVRTRRGSSMSYCRIGQARRVQGCVSCAMSSWLNLMATTPRWKAYA